jgi:paraquat-inducible protein B
MIEGGLRAQLALESFVTGLLYVKLDLRPNAPLRLVNDPGVPYQEIPTIPTPLEEVQMRAEQFFMKLEQTDIAGLVISLTHTAQGLDRLVNSPKFLSTFESFDTTLASLDATIASVHQLTDELRASVNPLTASFAHTSESAEQTFVKAQMLLGQLDAMVGADSPLQYELRISLEEVSNAARAVRLLAESIEQNPSILVRGRAAPSQ